MIVVSIFAFRCKVVTDSPEFVLPVARIIIGKSSDEDYKCTAAEPSVIQELVAQVP